MKKTMQTSKKAESFAGIVVGVFILSFVVLGIVNVLTYSMKLTENYDDANRIQILKQNLTNAVKKIDTSMLEENEIFYVHKNRATFEYEIYTGTLNESYRYIDNLGNTIDDIANYPGDIYSQLLWIANEDNTLGEANQVIKASITKLKRKSF